MSEVAVEIWRGNRRESWSTANVAVVDSLGQVRYWLGNPHHETFWRSSAKPFQAMPVIESGAAAQFGFNARDIAIISASHSGEAAHVDAVASILERIGILPSDLVCGVHPPSHSATRSAMIKRGEEPSEIHNNCSGKHAGMVALARALKAPVQGYHREDHPVQKAIRDNVAMMTGLKSPESLITAIDGCGVPTFFLPLSRMAYAYARLVDPRAMESTKAGAALIVSEAMRNHPDLISGTGRTEVTIQEAVGHRLVVKGGAEAVFCLGIPDKGLGVAIKVDDGNARTLPPLVTGVLAEVGVLSDDEIQKLADVIQPVLKNYGGTEVGMMKPVFRLKESRLK